MYTSRESVSVRDDSAGSDPRTNHDRINAIVLAGAVGQEHSWTGGLPRPLLPLPGGSLVEALLGRLTTGLDGGRAICANGHTALLSESIGGRTSGRIHYYEDRLPRGTAGCLKDCACRFDGDTFLVAGGAVWLEDDPAHIVAEHRRQGNALTVCCSGTRDAVQFGRHRALPPAGVYCCERSALEHVRDAGFQDIKEQLIPALREAGERVGVVVLSERTREVRTWSAYLSVLARSLEAELFAKHHCDRLAPGIWVGRDVEIAANARLFGPVFLGDGCRVGDGSVIVGPAVFGRNCRIGADSMLLRVVGHDNICLPAGVHVANQLLRDSMAQRGGAQAPRQIRVPAAQAPAPGPLARAGQPGPVTHGTVASIFRGLAMLV